MDSKLDVHQWMDGEENIDYYSALKKNEIVEYSVREKRVGKLYCVM